MYSTYRFNSAQDINIDVLNSIKTLFKSKSITIIVEENDDELDEITQRVLDKRLETINDKNILKPINQLFSDL